MCAQNPVDLIILEARVGACVQKPVDFVKLELPSYILIWSRHFLVDLMIYVTEIRVCAQKPVDL